MIEMTKEQKKLLKMAEVLDEVEAERIRQDAKWGEQNHENGTGTLSDGAPHSEVIDIMKHTKKRCDEAAAEKTLTWEHILTEEYFEAMAETDPKLLRAELVQVAAVAVSWIEAIDRKADAANAAHATDVIGG